MKKSLSLLLAVLLCLPLGGALTSCGGETTDSSSSPIASNPMQSTPDESSPETSAPTDGETEFGITKEEWNVAVSPISFENYTMIADGYVKQNDGTETKQYNVIKMTENRMTVDMTATFYKRLGVALEPPETSHVFFDFYENPDELAAQKTAQEQVFLALLADYENYQWNAEKQAYVNSNPVSVEIFMAVYNTTVSVVMTNGTLYVTDDGKFEKFDCDYAETLVMPDETIVIDAAFTWTFSDYGTTVIELDQPEQE